MSEYDDGFDAGILHQAQAERHEERLAAFRAIRRALEVARRHDDQAQRHLGTIRKHVVSGNFVHDDYLIEVETSANSAWHHAECAEQIRQAIRFAIGGNRA